MYQLYNTDVEKLRQEAYNAGRKDGFKAGFAAAQQQPAEKIQAAYAQGHKAALERIKNGCGY